MLATALLALGGCGSGDAKKTTSAGGGDNVVAPTSTTPAPPAFTDSTPTATAPPAATSTTPPPATSTPRPDAPGTQGDLDGRTVVLDPGHNGGNASHPAQINRLVPAGRGRTKPCNTTGAATASGYSEPAFNLDVALRARKLLRAHGARVVMTRTTDTGVGPCVNRRAAMANAARADAVVAVHADGAPSSGHGFHVIYPPDSGDTAPIYAASRALATRVHDALLASGVLTVSTYLGQDGYDERDDLAGLNLSTRPAIFVELGNMDNPGDAAKQQDPADRERLAAALARGVERFLRS